jgi:hypothetical protein
MSFQTAERILALSPALIPTLFPALVAAYGQELPDGPRTIRTIGGHWDDYPPTRIRAASLEAGTITPTALSDGRVAFRCLWQSDLAAEFDKNGLAGVEELTEEEFAALLPPAKN